MNMTENWIFPLDKVGYEIQISDLGDRFLDDVEDIYAYHYSYSVSPEGKAVGWLLEVREEGDFKDPTRRFYQRGGNGPGKLNDASIAYNWAFSKGYLEKVSYPSEHSGPLLASITRDEKGIFKEVNE